MSHLRKLSPQERIVAWRLATGRLITRDELAEALWGMDDDRDLPLGNGIQRVVTRLRAELTVVARLRREPPVKITSFYGIGCIVRALEDVARLRDLLADEIDRNAHYDDVPHGRPKAARPATQEAAHG